LKKLKQFLALCITKGKKHIVLRERFIIEYYSSLRDLEGFGFLLEGFFWESIFLYGEIFELPKNSSCFALRYFLM
jgi:hypothetical protein